MKTKIAVILFTITSIMSCKNNEAEKPKEEQKLEDIKKELAVTMQFKTNKPDEFRFMLNNIKKDEFQKKNIHIIEKVKPSSEIETIIANFGENMSNNLLINLGKQEKEILLSDIKIQYGAKALQLEDSNFNKIFNTNKFVTYDNESKSLTIKKVDGKCNPLLILKKKALNNFTEKK